MPPRQHMDRTNEPLGGCQRPLLKAAISEPKQNNSGNTTASNPLSIKEANKRRDSTENPSMSKKELISQNAKLFVSSLLNMLPVREAPKTSSALWECVLVGLKSNDFGNAHKFLVSLYKHPSTSRTAFLNRRRALSILAVLVAVDEWSGQTPLSSRNSNMISAGIAHGSPDAIAFGSWFYLKKRWSSSSISFKHIGDLLVSAAFRHHAACQAVLGIMLSPSSNLSNSCRRQLRRTYQLWVAHHEENQAVASEFRGPEKLDIGKKQNVCHLVGRKSSRDIQWLKAAASKGYFLAIYQIEKEMKEIDMERPKRRQEQSKLTPNRQRISSHEFFHCVQNAANHQIPYCAVRLAELLQNGIGCETSEDDARLWLQTAANLNVPVAMIEVHAKAKNENRQAAATLKRQFPGRKNDEFSFAKEHRVQAILKQNSTLLRHCEESMSRWQEEQEQHKRVLAFHIISNLSSRISDNMSAAVLHFIFEREKEGWL